MNIASLSLTFYDSLYEKRSLVQPFLPLQTNSSLSLSNSTGFPGNESAHTHSLARIIIITSKRRRRSSPRRNFSRSRSPHAAHDHRSPDTHTREIHTHSMMSSVDLTSSGRQQQQQYNPLFPPASPGGTSPAAAGRYATIGAHRPPPSHSGNAYHHPHPHQQHHNPLQMNSSPASGMFTCNAAR